MSVTSESDDKTNTTSSDDANFSGSDGGNNRLKKGPWTSAEDATLIEYITKHGEGNWNMVKKNTGLSRCGKSCRLRWSNHLRPNLKKGAFSQEEEELIIELHSKMGNKWARMAIELPGRTDNEIKNYWNTRIKRRQRAGLPIYPSEICSSDNTNALSSSSIGDSNYTEKFDIPIIEFKTLQFPHRQFYQDELLNFPTSYHSSSLSAIHPPPKRLRALETFSSQTQYHQQIPQSFMHSSSAHDPSSDSTSNHGFVNSIGNPCSSSELPSLQTQVGSWAPPSSPLPSFESVDGFIQELQNECTTSFPEYADSDMVLGMEDGFSQDFHWGEAPLCHSSSPVFSGNSFDGLESLQRTQGCSLQEPSMTFTRPDLMLDCFGPAEDCSLIGDTVKKLITDGLSRNSKKPNCSSSSPHVHDDSCAWNAMSTV